MAPNPIILHYHFGNFMHWRVKMCIEWSQWCVYCLLQWRQPPWQLWRQQRQRPHRSSRRPWRRQVCRYLYDSIHRVIARTHSHGATLSQTTWPAVPIRNDSCKSINGAFHGNQCSNNTVISGPSLHVIIGNLLAVKIEWSFVVPLDTK